MIEYINKAQAIIEMMENNVDHTQGTDGREVVQILEDIPAADVISKADMITLLEETEKDITKGVEASPTGMMIKAVFGVIKCKVNMWKEISSAPYQEDEA